SKPTRSHYDGVVTTSFCGLTLLASGGTYQEQLDGAVDYVIKNMFVTAKEVDDFSNWTIAIGGFFLCEYYAAQKKKDSHYQSARIQAVLERVVDEACQRMEDTGGWGHTPRIKNALGYRELVVVSNWMLATLGACERLGCKVPPDKVKQAMQFVQ